MHDIIIDKNTLWIAWFSVSVVFFLIEIFTPTFIVIFFSGGAIIAGCTALLDASPTIQVITFFCSSIVLLVLLRKRIPHVFGEDTVEDEALTDSSKNATALTVEPITSTTSGRIKYQGTFWNAEASESIASGETVTILTKKESDPNTFIVKRT